MSTFRVLGALGWLIGVAVALLAAHTAHRPAATVVLMAGLAVCTFLALTVGSGIVSGEISLTFYHHLVAVMLVVAVWSSLTRGGALAVLDLAAIGVLGFLVFGRLGCLAVGCCHGKPRAGGVVYGTDHVADGFPEELAGVPLAPVQAWESAISAVLVASSLVLLTRDPGPGVTAAFIVGGYGASRFWLETMRGDPDRPVWAGFSEAQWTSALLSCVVGLSITTGVIPADPVLVVCAAAPASLAMVALLRRRRGDPRDQSLTAMSFHHYELGATDMLPESAAQQLADAILSARHPGCTGSLFAGATGEFHLVVREPVAALRTP